MSGIQEAAVGSRVHISLDENLLGLRDALRDLGFKVTTFSPGTPDEEMYHQISYTLVLTKNVQDFLIEAVIHDFDIIDVRQIKFIDTEKTRKNQTAQKIAKALRESGVTHKRGTFQLIVQDDGKWEAKQLI